MAFKDALLPLTSFPDATSPEAIEQAVRFSALLGARISAVAFELELPDPAGLYFDAFDNIAALIADARQKTATNARELTATFQRIASDENAFEEVRVIRCVAAEVDHRLVEEARTRDVAFVPVEERDSVEQWYTESLIFGSGRPTIILPGPGRRRDPSLEAVAVAWDASRPAARAVADSLPLLQRAAGIRIVTVTNEKSLPVATGASLRRHLARHGVEAELDEVDANERRIGEALRSYIDESGSELLVMGAYGHSRMREFVLGGATRSMLADPPVPLFLSH